MRGFLICRLVKPVCITPHTSKAFTNYLDDLAGETIELQKDCNDTSWNQASRLNEADMEAAT